MDRPDYIKCVSTDEYDGPDKPLKKSWCGRDVSMEWAFVNANHAALNARRGGSPEACPECVEAIIKALKG